MRPRSRSLLALVLAVFGGLLRLSARGALSAAAPPEPTPEVTAALKEGQEAETTGKRDEAAALYRRALHLAQESKDRPGEAAALNRLAGGLIYQKPLDALEYLRQAEVILRDLGDQPGLARCLLNLGNACQISSQPDQALRYYDACGTLAEEIGDRSLQASALANSGTVFIRTGRPHEALRRLLTALPIQEASGRRDTVLRTL